MDDDEFQVLEPMRHNRWAVIVPALACTTNMFEELRMLFSNYTTLAAQHGMQKHYDQKFREIVNEHPS